MTPPPPPPPPPAVSVEAAYAAAAKRRAAIAPDLAASPAGRRLHIPVRPRPAPRLTRGSLHTRRAVAYAAYKAELRLWLPRLQLGNSLYLEFLFRTPDKGRHFTPHLHTPDLDNLVKAVLDTFAAPSDAHVHALRAKKLWAPYDGIVIGDYYD